MKKILTLNLPNLGTNSSMRTYKKEKMRELIRDLLNRIKPRKNIIKQLILGNLIETPIKIEIEAYTDSDRTDLDNIIKSVCDCLQGTIIINDVQIEEIHAKIFRDCNFKFVVISIFIKI